MKEPAFVKQTLAWCNAKRKEQGRKPLKKLPKGIRKDPLSCPCGAATGLHVFYHHFENNGATAFWTYRNVPESVSKFVTAFDSGKLPQYEQ